MANWGIVDFLWMSIYILGALAFTSPSEYRVVAVNVFWAIVAWNLMSTPSWTIGNWIRFYILMGLLEEHELASASHSLFLTLRVIPSMIVSSVSAIAAAVFLTAITGANILVVRDPLLLAASLVAILAMATLYSLTLAFLSVFTSAPAPLLDMLNFVLFVAGGIAVPVSRLPAPLRIVAIATPYSHPSELMRYATTGMKPYLGVAGEAIASIAFIALLATGMTTAKRAAMKLIRREGPRGIGRT
ncbi:MAG: ABC transporter permease [Pyrodictiaceae archaeon]